MHRSALASVVFALVAAVGCRLEAPVPEAIEQAEGAVVADGSPEGVGILAFLNAAGTTQSVLDVGVGLDKRAAANLVGHRDGADHVPGTKDDDAFGTVEEVDAVPYVGPTSFDKLVAYAKAHGYVPEGDDPLGVYDGVSFTVDEAAATVALANTAPAEELDVAIDLDARAAANIVAARPLSTVLALSKLGYVGTSALTKLKAHAAAAPVALGSGEVVALLGPAVDGLYHTSESDYPFTVVNVAGAGATAPTAADIKARIASIYVPHPGDGTLAERSVEVTTLEAFFDRYTVQEDWWEPSQIEQAPRFKAVYDILRADLADVAVFRIGRKSGSWLVGSIDVYIVGRSADGALVGLYTVSVET